MLSSESVVCRYRRTRKSQWEQLLAEVALEDEEAQEAGPTSAASKRKASGDMTEEFATGSEYRGPRDVLGWCGRGRYVYQHGVEYEGDFLDGCFHGKGVLLYPGGARVEGHWRNGRCLTRQITFADGLAHEDRRWGYCAPPDRRFVVELRRGLQPAGQSFLTDAQPSRQIPRDHFDAGDGFYRHDTRTVHDAGDGHVVLRAPGSAECAWIVDHCRKAWDEPVGFRPDLYEQWFDCRHATANAPSDQYQGTTSTGEREHSQGVIEQKGISEATISEEHKFILFPE